MHNFILCFLSTAGYWAKYIWGQGSNIHYVKSNAKEKDDHKFREKHQILRKFCKIFNIRREAIGTWAANILFTYKGHSLTYCLEAVLESKCAPRAGEELLW